MPSDAESFGWVSTDSEGEDRHPKMVKLEKHSSDEDLKRVPIVNIKREKLHTEKIIPGQQETRDNVYEPLENNNTPKSVRNNGTVSDNTRRNKLLLDTYLEHNTHLVKSTKTCSYDVSPDEEIFLLQCPPSIDTDHLLGLDFLDRDKKKFKLGHKAYDCVLSNAKNTQVSLLLPPSNNAEYRLQTFNVLGNYVIKERLKGSNDVEVLEEATSVVPFPDNLKERHPLFGANYKSQIEISPSIKEKFNSPVPKLPKARKIKEEPMEDVTESVVEVKKSKKRKAEESFEEVYEPKKKIKKENMWLTETSIEQNLFDIPVKSKKKSRQSL